SDATKHVAFYGNGCTMGDGRLCAFDYVVTTREANTANQLRNAAAGLGASAAVLGAAGVVFVVLAPKAAPPASDSAPSPATGPVSVRCGAGSATSLLCSGTF